MTTRANVMEKNRAHFAVVVGINRYPGISDLNKAKNDAEGFYDWLVSGTGGRLPESNVEVVMVDDDVERGFSSVHESRPNLSDVHGALLRINDALEELVEEEPEIVDHSRLYIYAAGHGIVPNDSAGALAMANSSLRHGSFEHLGFAKYGEWYRSSFIFREVIVFADCCRTRQPLLDPMGPPWRRAPAQRGSCEYIIVFATEYGTEAREPLDDDDIAHGYFTQAVIDGLEGGAARRDTGEIDLNALWEYVVTSLEWQLKDRDFTQSPQAEGARSNPVLRPAGLGTLPRPQRRMTLHLPKGGQGQIELWRRGTERTGIVLDAAEETHVLELEEDTYELRPLAGTELANRGAFRVIAKGRDEHF